MSLSTHTLADEFRRIAQQGIGPGVDKFIEAHQPVTPSQLAELLIVDQSLRWTRNESATAEQYFARYPQLLEHGELAVDIVFSEFLCRERLGHQPAGDEFADRFPRFADVLRDQIDFHQAIRSMDLEVDQQPLEGEPDQQADLNSESGFPRIPGYQITTELGRGGIGIVFKAKHVQLNRPVAVKMLLAGHFASPNLLRRFLVEAEATARLQHPNIVQIYEVGQYEGRPFLALEYVNGGTLAQWTAGRPHPPREAATLVQSLASAVQFAHQQGVVHRDLKPGNVLIQHLSRHREQAQFPPERLDSTPINGCPDLSDRHTALTGVANIDSGMNAKPGAGAGTGFQLKIADFGLAKMIAGDSNAIQIAATMSGDVLGTAAYMSPEQAQGKSENTSGSTDVYSLGAILYELLTGRPPFVGLQPLEVLGQVISDEPVRPSHLVRRMPNDIQTICLKCLEKLPGRRYGSAGELADDLARFLADQPIVARHTTALERGWRWCRRHPVKTSLAVSIAAILVLVASFSSVYSVMLGRQLTMTFEAKDREKSAKVDALYQLWESRLSQADAIRTSGHIGQRFESLRAINEARALVKSIEFSTDQLDRMRNATIACLAQPDFRMVSSWPQDPTAVYNWIAIDANQTVYAHRSVESGNEIVVRRPESGDEIARIAAPAESDWILSPDGKKLAVVNDHCRVYRLAETGFILIFETACLGRWGFLPDSQRILGTDENGELVLVDLEEGRTVRKFGSFSAQQVAVSPNSKWAALVTPGSVQVIDLKAGKIQLRVPGVAGSGNHLAWSPNSDVLAVSPYSDGVVLWDVSSGARLTTLEHSSGEMVFSFNSTGELFLTCDRWGKSMILWDVSSGEKQLSQTAIDLSTISANETGGFAMLQLLDDGNIAHVAIDHSQIFQTLPLIHAATSNAESIDLRYSPNGQLLAVAINGNVEILNTQTLVPLQRLVAGHCYLQFDADSTLYTLNQLGLFRWPVAENPETPGEANNQAAIELQFGPPQFVGKAPARSPFDVSPDGKIIGVPDSDGAIVWTDGNAVAKKTSGSHPDVRRLSIRPDGKHLATAGWIGGRACIWDLESREMVHTIETPDCCLVQYSPNGKWLATNSTDVRIWDSESWAQVATIQVQGQSASGVSVCFSPDSEMIAVSDSMGGIHLCNSADGHEIVKLTNPNQQKVFSIAFDCDGVHLATLSPASGGVLNVWDLSAIHEELQQRDLDWLPVHEAAVSITALGREDISKYGGSAQRKPKIESVRFLADVQFKQLEAIEQVRRAQQAADNFDFDSARAAIVRAIELRPTDPLACNNLAWLLATGPLPLRNPEAAVALAQRAMDDDSNNESQISTFINTLGVALYRSGKFLEAQKVLEQSLARQTPDSQPFDLYFLSLCSSRLEDSEQAREYFNRAEVLVQQHNSQSSFNWQTELTQFAEEARLLLKD